jgi:hypothetical protein
MGNVALKSKGDELIDGEEETEKFVFPIVDPEYQL